MKEISRLKRIYIKHYKKYDQAIKSFKKKGNTYTNKDYQIVVTKNNIKTTYIGSR